MFEVVVVFLIGAICFMIDGLIFTTVLCKYNKDKIL
jgi:hypothetical protein